MAQAGERRGQGGRCFGAALPQEEGKESSGGELPVAAGKGGAQPFQAALHPAGDGGQRRALVRGDLGQGVASQEMQFDGGAFALRQFLQGGVELAAQVGEIGAVRPIIWSGELRGEGLLPRGAAAPGTLDIADHVAGHRDGAERAGRGTLPIDITSWTMLKMAGFVNKEAKGLLELQHMFDGGVLLETGRFARLVPGFKTTPAELAIDETVVSYRKDREEPAAEEDEDE